MEAKSRAKSKQSSTNPRKFSTNDISEIKKIILDFIGEQRVIKKRHDQRLDYLEKNQGDMSQKMDNVQQTLSRLTNTLTIQERCIFPYQPQQNPRGIDEVETNEGNYKKVKAIMTLKSGRQIQQPSLPTPLEEVDENPKEIDQGKIIEEEASKGQTKESKRIVIRPGDYAHLTPPPFPSA